MIIPMTTGADTGNSIEELLEQGRNKNQLQQSDFMLLMIAQLQNQDPLSPLSDQEFVQQLTQFNILDQVTAFNESLTSMLTFQATGLIGQRVEGVLESGELVSGEVVEVVLLNQTATLVLDTGQSLTMDGLVRVLPPAEPATA